MLYIGTNDYTEKTTATYVSSSSYTLGSIDVQSPIDRENKTIYVHTYEYQVNGNKYTIDVERRTINTKKQNITIQYSSEAPSKSIQKGDNINCLLIGIIFIAACPILIIISFLLK